MGLYKLSKIQHRYINLTLKSQIVGQVANKLVVPFGVWYHVFKYADRTTNGYADGQKLVADANCAQT